MIYNKNTFLLRALLVTLLVALAIFFAGCGDNSPEIPGETPGETPDDNIGETPDDNIGETPDDNPGETPDDNPGETPDDNPGEPPDDNPSENPDDNPTVKPATTGKIAVKTTSTYCYVDNYSFTATVTGSYTFTIPAGLGFISSTAISPEVDCQLSPNGGSVKIDLTKGSVLRFAVGSVELGSWTISWKAVEGEVEAPIVPTYDINIDSGDEDGYIFTYTATKTGNLVVSITDLAYDYMGDGRYVTASADSLEMAFARMYRLVVNGETFKTPIATVAVRAGDKVTISLYCQYGYATKANIETSVKLGSGGSGSGYPADTSYGASFDAGDTDGVSFSHTVTSGGELTITVTDLEYDYKGEGEYHLADSDTLKYGFSKMFALVINGENVGAYTTTLTVKAGEIISIQLYSHQGYATKANIVVGYSFSEGSGGVNTPALGSETNPIILGSFPSSVTIVSDTEHFTYYVIAAQKSGNVTFTWSSADSWYMITELSADGGNTRNDASGHQTESFTFAVAEGRNYAVCLGCWSNPGSVTITITYE